VSKPVRGGRVDQEPLCSVGPARARTRSHLHRDSSRVGAGTRLSREVQSAMSQPEKSLAYASWHLRANAWMNQRDRAAGANAKSNPKSVEIPLWVPRIMRRRWAPSKQATRRRPREHQRSACGEGSVVQEVGEPGSAAYPVCERREGTECTRE